MNSVPAWNTGPQPTSVTTTSASIWLWQASYWPLWASANVTRAYRWNPDLHAWTPYLSEA